MRDAQQVLPVPYCSIIYPLWRSTMYYIITFRPPFA
nr:MAG TPA: hypothetical protein [Caudoviricetes sp.]DAY99437.1 MAG TPA: hypothetical protein [Caudoviricetes sp.]